ncbi:D-alanyl-D-alanine carboxypeptidase, partial [Streptococcus suis]
QRNQTYNVPTATFTTDIKEIDAPLKAGTLVVKLQLKDQDLIGNVYISEQASVDMIIPSDIKEASWPFYWWNQFVRYFN